MEQMSSLLKVVHIISLLSLALELTPLLFLLLISLLPIQFLAGTGTDTLIFDAATTKVDSHFSEINTFEKLTLGNGTNSITLGTVAANAGFATVTGSAGADTIDATNFDGA